jgi:hypothetical protein
MEGLLALEGLLATTDAAGPAGSDEANLLPSGRRAADGGRVTNVLMVSTSVLRNEKNMCE